MNNQRRLGKPSQQSIDTHQPFYSCVYLFAVGAGAFAIIAGLRQLPGAH